MAAPPPGSTCNCPIVRNVSVVFTGSTPAPSNGYQIGYRKSGSSADYTFVTPNPTSSPATIPNVPVCENLQILMRSQCDNSQVSADQLTTLNAYPSYVCNDTISGSNTHNGFYTYPDYLLNVQGASNTVTLSYDVINHPNRFTVYDHNGNLVVTSGWRGTAAYAGPWGASLSTATTGTISFAKGTECFYRLVVESNTNASVQDSFTVTMTCPINDPVVPTITVNSCGSGIGSYTITAPSGTNMKVKLTATGQLINQGINGNCAVLRGTITSSTGPSDTEDSATVSGTSTVSIGGSNSLFVDVTVPGVGYLVINTSTQTINASNSSTTATLTIFEVNGTASSITQAVCVGNSTGIVSC